MAWMNNDGLYLQDGVEKTVPEVAGDYKTFGPLREIEVKIDLTTLTTSANTILSNTVFFPKMRIEEVTVEVQTAATSSSSGTINIGLVKTDRTTELDYDGFVAAEVKGTYDTAGKKITYIAGTSKAGALIGTTLTEVGYLTAGLATAVYQTGVIYVRIKYRPN